MFMESVCVQVSLVQALVPRDEADEHSAILEVRAGGCGGGPHAIYKIATEMFTVQLRVTSHCLSNHCYCTLLYVDRCRRPGGLSVCSRNIPDVSKVSHCVW